TTGRMLAGAGFLVVLGLAAPFLWPAPIWTQEPPVTPTKDAPAVSAQADPAKEIAKLREEVRQVKDQLGELRIQNKSIIDHLTFAPGMEVENEDYAEARARFHTKLLRKGPSPQGWRPLKPPEGVSEVEYPSGDMRLKAWVNRPMDEGRK